MMNDYRTDWMLADRINIDKTIFDIIQNAMRNSNAFRNKELFFQYVAFLVVRGARRIEGFLRPPTIEKFDDDGKMYYKITAAVAKHYDNKVKKCKVCGLIMPTKKSQRQHREGTASRAEGGEEVCHSPFVRIGSRLVSSHRYRAENSYEKALFEFLLKGRQQTTIDFSPLLPPRYRRMGAGKLLEEYDKRNSNMFNGITTRFSMLKADITDGRRILHSNIVPHMLRHARAADLLIIHHYREDLVQRLMDWDTRDMLFAYADLKGFIGEKEEAVMYKEMEAQRR